MSGLRDFLRPEALRNLQSRKLTEAEKLQMSTIITDHEADDAIKSLKMTSLPGPDGVTASVLKHIWPFVKTPWVRSVNEYITQGSLSNDYLTTRLCLIPKKGRPHYFEKLETHYGLEQ